MYIDNCRQCGRLFQYVGISHMCPDCRNEDEATLKVVRDYIWEHQGATTHEVSEATGVSVTRIEKFIREERLEITEDSPIKIPCQKCGTKIRTGRFCELCSIEIKRELQTIANKFKNKPTEEVEKAKLYYFNKEKFR